VGLSLLRERVAEAGATITIVSAPGQGTTIRLQLAQS
jgi:signal transduction histidine kinase